MTTLVTGASGFIGGVLSRRLVEKGLEVRALLRRDMSGPWTQRAVWDLGMAPLPEIHLSGVETVFHLAGVAHSWGLPAEVYWRVNVEGSRQLIEAAAAFGVKHFVYFSSVKAVAEPPPGECVDESWDSQPEDAYGRSKREAEDYVLERGREAGIHTVVLRPALVYGPGVKGNLQKIMRLVDSGLCPPLPDTGNRRSMVHVEDLCALAIRVIDEPLADGKRYFVADPRPYSTRELYAGLCRALGRSVPGWVMPAAILCWAGMAGDLGSRLLRRPLPLGSGTVSRLLDSACYDASRCRNEVGWQPEHDLLSSLPEMVAAYQEGRRE